MQAAAAQKGACPISGGMRGGRANAAEASLLTADWGEQVQAYSQATVFHMPSWAEVLTKTYGHKPVPIACRDAEGQSGLILLMEVCSPATGRRGVSMPFSDACPPLVSHRCMVRPLWSLALQTGRERRWAHIEIRGALEGIEGVVPSVSYLGHRLDLSPGADRLFARMDGSFRRAIRMAERSGVRVEINTTAESIQDYYMLHCRTRRKHGLPPQSRAFFSHIHELILEKGEGFTAIARQGSAPIAGAVFFTGNGKAAYKYGASDERFLQLRPNHLAMWVAIARLAGEGYAWLDFGRTSVGNEGLRRYKLSWGAEEETIAYHRFDLKKNAFARSADHAAGWHNSLFRLLPPRIAQWCGAFLYRHLD